MPCFSTGIAVSNVVHVDAPAQLLWEVLTDIEGYPNFVTVIQSTRIQLPDPPISTSLKKQRVQVGTQIYESRAGMKKHTNKKISFNLRRSVTKVVENTTKNEYSIAFITHLDEKKLQKFDESFCNTSTLSIVPGSSALQDSVSQNDTATTCTLIGSFAVEIDGGPSNFCCFLCFPFFNFKKGIRSHAQQKFMEEMQCYASEAERRYHQKSSSLET